MPAHLSEGAVAGVVVLRHDGGLSWTEISRRLQVHPETARQAYQRVLERSDNSLELRELLEHCKPKPL